MSRKPLLSMSITRATTVDVALLAEALASAAKDGKLPKVIVPTDLYGQSVDLEALEALAAEYGIKLVVDSAESLGATYRVDANAGPAATCRSYLSTETRSLPLLAAACW